MPTTTGMKGAGYYDRHSTAQQSAIRALQDWVEAAVADVLLPAHDEPVTVLDLGSSEGGNAIRLMASIVAGLRRRTDQPLRTIYSDLPSNDFNRLFANLEEVRGAGLVVAGVYPEAVGGSSTARCCPRGRSISLRPSTPSIGSTACHRPLSPTSSPTASRTWFVRDSPRLRGSRRPSPARPSRT